MKKIAPPGHGWFSPHKKSPGVQYAQDECTCVGPGPLRLTAACAVPPCFFTCVKPLIVIQLRSAVHLLRIADLAPSIGSLLSWRVTLLHHRWRIVFRLYLI